MDRCSRERQVLLTVATGSTLTIGARAASHRSVEALAFLRLLHRVLRLRILDRVQKRTGVRKHVPGKRALLTLPVQDVRVLLGKRAVVHDHRRHRIQRHRQQVSGTVALRQTRSQHLAVEELLALHVHATLRRTALHVDRQRTVLQHTLQRQRLTRLRHSHTVIHREGVHRLHRTRLAHVHTHTVRLEVHSVHEDAVEAGRESSHHHISLLLEQHLLQRNVLRHRAVAHHAIRLQTRVHQRNHRLHLVALATHPLQTHVERVGVHRELLSVDLHRDHVLQRAQHQLTSSVRLQLRRERSLAQQTLDTHVAGLVGDGFSRAPVHLRHVLHSLLAAATEQRRHTLQRGVVAIALRATLVQNALLREMLQRVVHQRHVRVHRRLQRNHLVGDAEHVREVLVVAQRRLQRRLRTHVLRRLAHQRDRHVAQQRHGIRQSVQQRAHTQHHLAALVSLHDRLVVHVATHLQLVVLLLHHQRLARGEEPVGTDLLHHQQRHRVIVVARRKERNHDLVVLVRKERARALQHLHLLLHALSLLVHHRHRVAQQRLPRQRSQRPHVHQEATVQHAGDEVHDEHAAMVHLREGEGLHVTHRLRKRVGEGLRLQRLQTVQVDGRGERALVVLEEAQRVQLEQPHLHRLHVLQLHLHRHRVAHAVEHAIVRRHGAPLLLRQLLHAVARQHARLHLAAAQNARLFVHAQHLVRHQILHERLRRLLGEQSAQEANDHVAHRDSERFPTPRVLRLLQLALHARRLQVAQQRRLLEHLSLRLHAQQPRQLLHGPQRVLLQEADAPSHRLLAGRQLRIARLVQRVVAETVHVTTAEGAVGEQVDAELLLLAVAQLLHLVERQQLRPQALVHAVFLLQRRYVQQNGVHHAGNAGSLEGFQNPLRQTGVLVLASQALRHRARDSHLLGLLLDEGSQFGFV